MHGLGGGDWWVRGVVVALSVCGGSRALHAAIISSHSQAGGNARREGPGQHAPSRLDG